MVTAISFLRLKGWHAPAGRRPGNPGLLPRTGRSGRHRRWVPEKLGPGRQIVSKTTRCGVSRFGGQAGTQVPDATPPPTQNRGSRAGSTTHILPADSAAQTVDLLQRFAVPDWPVMCVRPIAITNNLRAHQSLESVYHLNRHWVGCMSSTRVTDPAQTVGAAAGRKPDDERADLPGLRGSLIISFPPARAATLAPRSRHAGCRDPAAADMFDFQARQRGRGAVPASARPVCGLPGGLAQDSKSAISRRSPETT